MMRYSGYKDFEDKTLAKIDVIYYCFTLPEIIVPSSGEVLFYPEKLQKCLHSEIECQPIEIFILSSEVVEER